MDGQEREIENLTSHLLKDVSSGQEFPPSGVVAKVDYYRDMVSIKLKGYAKKIKVSTTVYREIVGLPEYVPGSKKLYVVSAPIINALEYKNDKRNDVMAPGPKITGANNETVGCNSFRFNG